jgi:Glyoxalase-like domain
MPQPYPHGELLIVIDCADLDRSAAFWSAVLGYTASPAGTGPYRSLEPESGAGIDVLLQRVSESRARRTGCTWTCAPPTWTPRSGVSSASGQRC